MKFVKLPPIDLMTSSKKVNSLPPTLPPPALQAPTGTEMGLPGQSLGGGGGGWVEGTGRASFFRPRV